jgi:DNA-binding transcriptional LysR family regulator
MLDGVSLDQLRTFIAAADEGSFSAAGRRLRRAQSVVSQTLANLEGQLGVKLFDRSARYPVLTEQGRALLTDARAVAGNMDLFKARAKGLAGGLEPELRVVADVMFPLGPLTDALAAFEQKFPTTALKLYIEATGPLVAHVLDGRCTVGVMASLPLAPPPPQFTCERLLTIGIAMVVAPTHPLAAHRAPIPRTALAKHVQLVHIDRSDLPPGFGIGVVSPRAWLLAHLGAKLAFLRAGFGFGALPLHVVEADLASGALVQIATENLPVWSSTIPISAVYRTDSPPGPAGRWLIEHLKQEEAWRLKEKTFLAAASVAASVKRQRSRSRARKPKGRSH